MRNKGKFVIILILVFYVWTCSNNKENIIELKATENDSLKLHYTSKIVQLETIKESMLGNIFKINIDFYSDRIFVLSDFNIFFFDINGNFLNKLKVGNGPSEINRAVAFTLNTNKKLIYVIDNPAKLCVYDYNGNIINKYNIANFSCCDISFLDDDNVFLLRNYVGESEKFFVGLYNIPNQNIIKKFISAAQSLYSKNTIYTANNFSYNNGKIYLNLTNIFGLFEYENSNFKQKLYIDLGNKTIPKKFIKNYQKRQPCDFGKDAKSKHYIPFMLLGFEFKQYYFFVVDDDNRNCFVINSENNKVYQNGDLSSYFNLPDIRIS